MATESVITIGTFDGVHQGHRSLVTRARELAGPTGVVRVLAFDPCPASVLRKDDPPARLTTFEARRALLLEAGADEVVRLEPRPEILSQSAQEFIEHLRETHGVTAIVEGPDFRFGRGREGDVMSLDAFGREMGFRVEIVDPLEVALTDQTLVPARSTMVRWLLSHGRVSDAAVVLGRQYGVSGTVVQGDRRGREIGFPTANVETNCMLPASGVYAGVATLPNGQRVAAAMSVGRPPMFPDAPGRLEAHLLDVITSPGEGGALLIEGVGQEYGWDVTLQFECWLREQVRYESLELLCEALARDCENCRWHVTRLIDGRTLGV